MRSSVGVGKTYRRGIAYSITVQVTPLGNGDGKWLKSRLDKPLCLVRDETVVKIPFDTGSVGHFDYDSELRGYNLEQEVPALASHVEQTMLNFNKGISYWKVFGMRRMAERTEGQTGVAGALSLLVNEVSALKSMMEDQLERPSSLSALSRDPAVLERILAETDGSISRAARILGVQRKQLYRWMNKHGITTTGRSSDE